MPVVRLDPQYDNIRVRRYWALRVPISRPIPLTIFTVIATDTTDDFHLPGIQMKKLLAHRLQQVKCLQDLCSTCGAMADAIVPHM